MSSMPEVVSPSINPETGALTPEASLAAMRNASALFYAMAQRVDCHAFIEFTGLMNEFIKICQRAHDQGIDFQHANTHTQTELPVMPFEVNYINEKLECIFQGLSFASKSGKDQAAEG